MRCITKKASAPVKTRAVKRRVANRSSACRRGLYSSRKQGGKCVRIPRCNRRKTFNKVTERCSRL